MDAIKRLIDVTVKESWNPEMEELGNQARAELESLRAERDVSTLKLMDEIEMRHGIHEDRWGVLRGILTAALERVQKTETA